jgi:hypothetical protein
MLPGETRHGGEREAPVRLRVTAMRVFTTEAATRATDSNVSKAVSCGATSAGIATPSDRPLRKVMV